MSFNEIKVFGHLDVQLRILTGNRHVLCGGIPLLLCGDCFQKQPPGANGCSFYKSLVVSAEKAGDVDTHGPSTHAKGLHLMKMAKRVVLTRLMRVDTHDAEAKTFTEIQLHMRDVAAKQPVSDTLIQRLRVVSHEDVVADETWRFAPIGVLSHVRGPMCA